MPRKLLVLTYEFPPTGGAGVQRIMKWCRYLPECGWEPLVVTTSTGWSRPKDPALLDEVAEVRVVRTDPRNVSWTLAKRFAALKGGSGGGPKPSGDGSKPGASAPRAAGRPLSTRIASWVTVPDPAVTWVDLAVDAALQLAETERPDAVLATLPPYSVGLAGKRVAAKLGVPLVTDLRDAWAGNVSHSYPTSWHRSRSLALEREVMSASALVTAAAETAAEEAAEYGAPATEVIYNGFDTEVPRHEPNTEAALKLVFLGRFFAATDPGPLLEGIAHAVASGADVTLDVIGPPYARGQELASALGIDDRVTWHGFTPRATALAMAAASDVGVIVLAHSAEDLSWYPLKAFEYLGMRLPVLVLGPAAGVTSKLVARANAGWTVEGRADEIATRLAELAEAKRAGTLELAMDDVLIGSFSRRSQSQQLAAALDRVVAATDEGSA